MTVIQLVERERKRLRRLYLAAGIALAAAATCVLLALGVWALGDSRWLSLPRPAPFFVWLVVLTADAAIIRWTWHRVVRGVSRINVAAEIEREQALRAGALRGAIETADTGALGRRAAERLSSQLGAKRTPLAPVARRNAGRRALQTLAGAAGAALLLGWAAPVFDDGLSAVLLPVRAWKGTLLPKPAFRNLPTHVLRGESLTLDVVAPGRASVMLTHRTTGEAWRTTTLRSDSTRAGMRTVVGPLRGDLMLVVSDGRTTSDTAVVHVTDRPFVGAVSMRATYPAYLGRPPEGLPIGEPARVPRGTLIEVRGRASTQLTWVRLVSGDRQMPLRAEGHAFEGRFEAQQSGTWTWNASGASGPISDVPLPIELDVVADSVPRVEIVSPSADSVVAADVRVALQLAASDDHGLATIEVHSWRESAKAGRQPVVAQRLASGQSTLWSDVTELDLAPRGLEPGDVLHVKVVATDNSPWTQRGESRELKLRIPTMEERRAIARDLADSAAAAARSAVSEQRSLEQRTQKAVRDQSRNRASDPSSSGAQGAEKSSMSYESAEQARSVAKDQRAMMERVQELQKQAAALRQQLEAAGALDSTLARQLRDAQDLLRQALTPELLEQMKKLEQAAQQLEGEQSRQAMRDLAAMQQRLREQLEKTAEMLKRAALEGAMETLKDEAKEIAERERRLADSAADKGAAERRDEAKNLADRSERFSDDVKKLQQRLEKEKAEPGAEKAKEATQRADASEEKMRDLAQSLERAAQREGDRQRQQNAQNGDATRGEKQQSGQQQKSGQEQNAGQEQKNDQAQKAGQEGKPGQEGAQAQNKSAQEGKQGQSGERGQQGQRGEQGQQGEGGQQGAGEQQQARDAAAQMERAAKAMQEARDSQVQEWKQELTSELDRAIQETLQMAREESALEQKARSGQAQGEDLRGQQSALKQGIDQTAQRLQQEGRKSSLLSGRSQRAIAEAQQKVAQATQALTESRGSTQAASAMSDAAESLNRAAASLARDRERANSASSASGFSEMLQQLQELAKRQGSINSQAQGLMPMSSGQTSAEMQATARALARQQRQVAQQLDEMSDGAGGDRTAQLAREARQLAQALDGGRVDAATLARQQQLFRRLLDAGRTLEKDEREDSDKREARAATNAESFRPDNTNASGKSAQKFREPDWNELRGLTPEERRAILEYFKRINAQSP